MPNYTVTKLSTTLLQTLIVVASQDADDDDDDGRLAAQTAATVGFPPLSFPASLPSPFPLIMQFARFERETCLTPRMRREEKGWNEETVQGVQMRFLHFDYTFALSGK